MTEETKCKRCRKPVHFYKAVIGGKRYGDCACDEPGRATTWIMDASRIWQVGHWKGAGYAPLQEVRR